MPLYFTLKITNMVRACFKSDLNMSIEKMHKSLPRMINCRHVTYSLNKSFEQKAIMKDKVCRIHVSSSRKALPPLLLLALRSVAKIGAVVSGRLIRKWWNKLSEDEKKKVWKQIYSKRNNIALVGTALIASCYLYYTKNKIEDPITKRKRFIILNQKQLYKIAEFEYQQQLNMFKSHIIPAWHPIHRRVLRVANAILLSNKDLKEIRDKIWTVTVVDRADITNAFALPHGKIFVFTGMLNLCTNDDQLAIVLAHEISHSILSHVAENLSKVFLIEFILLIPSIIIWSIFSDGWALFNDWLISNLANILIHLPFSRAIEKEADVVGLHLAAKSCFDIREAPVFWGKMKILSSDAAVEWLSTHPRHETRQKELQELLPEAIKIRESYNCSPLTSKFFFFK